MSNDSDQIQTLLENGEPFVPTERTDLYLGTSLDGKYRLEKLLGRGGMGAVYLAIHLGTERYVAVKLITPQFMRDPAFVGRFQREARAAGRLRHPNIVDVTDFGFAAVGSEKIAYLVMEYLDGCTLRDVLAEEKRLPLDWVIDIIEQVCSAVQEAHKQGIVHRDLKPDNIWLEPNRRGGYRAKVLDFGIAKLTEAGSPAEDSESHPGSVPLAPLTTQVSPPTSDQVADAEAPTLIDPLVSPAEEANSTSSPSKEPADPDLTGAGTILGTPSFMSPEQCRGATLDARTDVYSLGVIVYQMMCGTLPFSGDAAAVLRAHQESEPPPLRRQNPKIPQRIALAVMSALSKDPQARPQTPSAFANTLRANADGLSVLYRRAFALYSEYFPQFLKLSLLAHTPVILCVLLSIGLRLSGTRLHGIAEDVFWIGMELLRSAVNFVTASTISGLIAIVVTQLTLAPLRIVEVGPVLAVWRRRWRPFLKTSILATLRIAVGFVLLVVPGLVMTMRYSLWAPVALMEGLEMKRALERSSVLASRSWRTIIVAMIIQLLLPLMVERLIYLMIGLDPQAKETPRIKVLSELASLGNIILLPLLSIVPALLYLKMRQLGGETLTDVMAHIEPNKVRARWEQRMRTPLSSQRAKTG